MRIESGLVVAMVAALAPAACREKVQPGLHVSVAVTGNAKPGERATSLSLTFDRPMVADAAVGKRAEKPPLVVAPAVAGVARWETTRVLVFIPERPLPRSTRFEVRVPRGTRALDGKGLADDHVHAVETERLTVQMTLPHDGPHGNPTRWAPPDQRVLLTFNQPVRTADVASRCAYTTADRRIAARAAQVAEGDAGQRFEARPAEPLGKAMTWRFRCDEALTGAEGPLALVPSRPDAGPRQRSEVELTTYGALQISSIEPSGTGVNPDDVAITVAFTNPVATEGKPLPITIEPKIEGFPERGSSYDGEFSFNARNLPPHVTYKVSVAGGIRDVFGQTLVAPQSVTFRTGDPPPKLDVETGSWVVESARGQFPLWARNVSRIEVTAAAVPEAKVGALFEKLNWWDDEGVDLAALGLKTVTRTVEVNGKKNQWGQVALDPAALTGGTGAPTGYTYLALTAPEVPREKPTDPPDVHEVLANFTNLGVTTKLAAAAGLVWVTRLDDGAPVPGADVVIRGRDGKVRWRGRTGGDGTVVTPGRAVLVPPPADAEGDGEDEGEGEGEAPPRGLLISARLGADFTVADPERAGAFDAWNFDVPVDRGTHAERLRGFTHTDRGLYRPGDTVHLRGLVRTMKLGDGLRVPARRKAQVVVRDPRGELLVEKEVALSRFGGFTLDVRLPAAARLGDYVAETRLPQGTFRDHFSVEEYRAATFEARVTPGSPRYVLGERLRLGVESRYLYGAPVRGGQVKWRIIARGRSQRFEAHPDYAFDDERLRDEHGYAGEVESFFAEETQTLDAGGRAELRLPLGSDAFPQSRDLLVSAEVRDETRQAITANAVVPVHRARVAFGIAQPGPMVAAKKPATLKAIAVGVDGKRVAGQAQVTFRRREWQCAWESWGFRGSYRCQKKETDLAKQPLSIGADAPASVTFEPPASGEYWVIVEGKDDRGRPTATSTRFWAYGAGESPWQVDDSGRFAITADKPRYQPGDTARLLLRTPTAGATALLTIEREGVLEHRLVTAPSDGGALEVPIREAHGPNVHVSVLLARGRTGKGPRGMPHVRMGMVTLPVDTGPRRLAVAVSTDRASYRPGEKVTATVRVSDAAGAPVRAEVALAAADEGVLSLIAFKTPDPVPTFHAPWGLGVVTASQYARLARLPEPDEQRLATGGDGAGRLGTMRSRFLATAYWNPRVETDADGAATVTFAAPDNLTAFRVMAVAADAGDRFGSGDRRFTVRKPLQLVAALPRFLAVGDEARGGVLVINETGSAGTATVEAKVSGAKLVGPATRTVELPAGGRALVSFPVRAADAGELRLRFAAVLGDERDGVEAVLPVRHPTSGEAALVARGETGARAELPVKLPAGVVPGSATLEISVDPDGLAGIEEGLRTLVQYPYGCLEQTTSQLIALVAVEELARRLGLPELDGPKLQRFIVAGLEKVNGFQDESGGFALWRGSRPELYLTAFALWGMKLGADAGHPVPQRRVQDGIAYLRRKLGEAPARAGVHDELGELGGRAFALYVLNLLGQPEAAHATKLLEQKDRMPRFGLAFLAQALAGALGRDHARVAGILDQLLAAAERKPDAKLALIRERPDPGLLHHFSTDVRTSAIATDAFLYLRPGAPDLPALVRGLLAQRQHGVWSNTQENLYALVALAHYLKERPAQPTAVRVAMGDRVLLDEALATTGAARVRHVEVPVAPGAAPLVIEARQGTAHYQVRVRYRRDAAHQTAVSDGFELRRELLDPATGAAIARARAGEMVRVRLTMTVPEPRHRIALSSFLPAGLEPVNTRFATTAVVLPGAKATSDDPGWWIVARELRDDRVDVFGDSLDAGTHTIEYYARATTPGLYALPAAGAEEMYRPHVRGRTALGTFEVTEK